MISKITELMKDILKPRSCEFRSYCFGTSYLENHLKYARKSTLDFATMPSTYIQKKS